MNTLHVIYDSDCGLCAHCRKWLEAQPAFLTLHFVPRKSQEAAELLKDVTDKGLTEELIVVSDEGGVYRGAHAWIMCFYALENYRGLSAKLATPALMPLAKRTCELISQNRISISHLLGLDRAEDFKNAIQH